MTAARFAARAARYTAAVLALAEHFATCGSVPRTGPDAVDWWLELADLWGDVALYADDPFVNDRAHQAAENAERHAAEITDTTTSAADGIAPAA
ncbi:hypothetical protein [Saccharothrix hoggarensis]|uniref:Uncharacterized protein n=1 Tax=Saccharothrix hoggarensis TaxID=913853 RepID=A0ABW3R7B8_9PSEU